MPPLNQPSYISISFADGQKKSPSAGKVWRIHHVRIVHVTGTDSSLTLIPSKGVTGIAPVLSYIDGALPNGWYTNAGEVIEVTVGLAKYLIQESITLPFDVASKDILFFQGDASATCIVVYDELFENIISPVVSPARMSGWI